jgi:hypothetical protein
MIVCACMLTEEKKHTELRKEQMILPKPYNLNPKRKQELDPRNLEQIL